MEFKDFAEKRKRMCNHYGTVCKGCPLDSSNLPDRTPYTTCERWCLKQPTLAEAVVDYWTKNHPVLTNGEKFKEVFGENNELLKILSFYHAGKWSESEYIAPEEKQND